MRAIIPLGLFVALLFLSPLFLPAQERAVTPLGDAVIGDDGAVWVRGRDGWRRGDDGLPGRRVYPFEEERAPGLTSVAETADEELLLTGGRKLYRGGPGSWSELTDRREFGTYAYLTAVAGDPREPETVALGTSFHGLFISDDNGDSWTDITDRFPELDRGAGYYEDIASLAFGPAGESLYVLADLGRRLYHLDLTDPGSRGVAVPLPPGIREARELRSAGATLLLTAETETAGELSAYTLAEGRWARSGSALLPGTGEEPDSETQRRRALASGRRGIFVPFVQARGEALEEKIAFAERNGINAFVIDFKDDWGRVTFDAELPMARRIGATRSYLDLDRLVRRLDEAGIYLIGRVVVFKDRQLHGYDDHRYALRDMSSDEPWGVTLPARETESGETLPATLREHWVDQYSPDVWEYNVSLAEELARRGVDEIQFDYIRFPSDGPVRNIDYSHRPDGMDKEEALESFLSLARERIRIPIGVDVFGFNGYYEMDYLGQNIALIAEHVDVISPMYYPSHFASRFLGELDYIERAGVIYRNGTDRAARIVRNRALIRPYVQAFLIGSELEMDEPRYRRYLGEQIRGSEAGAGDGYLLWNFSGRYYMVE